MSAEAQTESAPLAFHEWDHEEFNQTIAQRFEKIVVQHGQRVAIRSASRTLTYGELNRLANRLAHALLAHNPEPGQRVALLLDHDAPLIAAMLGTLKAGKVCVVLAPAHPDARMQTILEGCGANIIVTDALHLDRANGLARGQRHVFNIEALPAGLAETNPGSALPPDALAFIIYTSGTTGQPRGVMQSHRSILHNLRRHTHGLKLHAGDTICLLSSCSAGQGMATALYTVLNGATLCPRDLGEESVAGLADWLIAEKITVYVSAATVFRHFVRTLTGRERFPHLRMVRLASEPVQRGDFDLFKAHFEPHCVFANTYSSSETGNLCQFFVRRDEEMPGDIMPIGFPPEDVTILLLGEDGKEVAQGDIGEIVVRSRYISTGYWNAPEQTRLAFESVPDSDERIYRTRDLGRRHPDGRIEHMGRADTQVKIRGFRVYPDEVRSRLGQHPQIADAVVDARVDAAGHSRLVAYIIARDGEPPAPKELRKFLKGSLPEFMVPGAFLLLTDFPATPNGKVDRNALRALPLQNTGPADAASSPKTALEETLAGIWTEILNLNQIGIHDSFFELGGDSLLVTQLAFRIGEVMRAEIAPSLLFEKATIAELSAHIQQLQSSDAVVVPPITRAARGGPLPISGTQERNWWQSQSRRDNLSNLLANGYVIDGRLDVDALQRTLNEVVRRHEPFRTTYEKTVNGIVQHVHASGSIPLKFIDLSPRANAEAEADALWTEEASQPIDLARGPIIRATLLKLTNTRHWLLTTVHHIVSDAWSRDNFLRDLAVLYAAYSAGRPSPLPDPEVHCGDFSVWQKNLLRPDGEVFRRQLAYWKKQLSNPPPKVEFPFACAEPRATSDIREGRLRYEIASDLAARLHDIGRREGATLFMTRLAAFAMLLHEMTGRKDFVVASYMTNRSRAETQNLIGFFSNLVMLRLDLSGNPTFRELLGRIRRVTLDATANADIPYDELMAALKAEDIKVPKMQMIFEVKYGDPHLRFGDLEVRRMDRRTVTMPWGWQVNVLNKGDASQGNSIFDATRFDPAGVAQAIEQYKALMARIAAGPGQRLSELCPDAPKARKWFWPFGK